MFLKVLSRFVITADLIEILSDSSSSHFSPVVFGGSLTPVAGPLGGTCLDPDSESCSPTLAFDQPDAVSTVPASPSELDRARLDSTLYGLVDWFGDQRTVDAQAELFELKRDLAISQYTTVIESADFGLSLVLI